MRLQLIWGREMDASCRQLRQATFLNNRALAAARARLFRLWASKLGPQTDPEVQYLNTILESDTSIRHPSPTPDYDISTRYLHTIPDVDT